MLDSTMSGQRSLHIRNKKHVGDFDEETKS